MSIQGLATHSEFFAEVADGCIGLAHRGHGESNLGRGHLVGPAASTASGARGRQASECALSDEFAFELSQGSEYPEDEFARRCGGVNGGTFAGKNLQSDPALGQIMNDVNQMAQVTAEAIKLPDDQRVPFAESFDACDKLRAVIFLPGRVVFIESIGVNARGDECIALQISVL